MVNCGYSAIIDYWGKVVVEGGEEELIFSADLDLDRVRDVRDRIAVYRDRQPSTYSSSLLK